jgi:hypothetical protein
VETKACCRCREERPLVEFWKQSKARDGLYSCCKACWKDPNSNRAIRRGNPGTAVTIEGDIARVELSNGGYAIIDASDASLVGHYWWNRMPKGHARTSSNGGLRLMMHQLLMRVPEGFEIDHRNGNKLDNRRENLRIVRRSINALNRPPNKANTSGYPGVSYSKRGENWQARAKLENREIYLGRFDNPLAAYARVVEFYETRFALPMREIAPSRYNPLSSLA